MNTEIIVAVIGAAAVIIAAVVGVWKKKSDKDSSINVNQKMGDGDNNTQIGVQNHGDKR